MTDTDTPRCGFKIGKYLLEGPAYKDALIRIIDEEVGETGIFDLTIIFFDGCYTEREGITVADFIHEINEVCRKADTMTDELKNRCINDFIQWRDTVFPQHVAESESEGFTVIEPEM
jgi:hypothetical protein